MSEQDELAAAQRELEEATARATRVAEEEVAAGLALERVGGQLNAEQMRADMEATRKRTERAHREVQRASERVKRELERQLAEQRADLVARMDRVAEALEPVKKRLALMQEGIETLGLYLSAAKGVRVIREGERADALEPIVIRQLVLAMDEESGLFAADGGVTAGSVDAFAEWLVADEERVQQIVPERKCVVAMVARWSEREHGNPWSSDPTDRVTHFIVRNGDALFATSVNDFMAGEVLVPRSDEFVGMFRRERHNWDTGKGEVVTLTPGTREYAEAMERSDARGRHFLRIGLVLQGLVDNSDVFAPLHPAGVNMLTDPSERSEKVRIVTDAEGGLESGAETFLEWRARTNAQLRPGMRIIGAFHGYDSPWSHANEWSREHGPGGHSRVFPSGYNAPAPPSGVPLLIEDRRPDGGLVCRFDRGKVYDRDLWKPNPDRPGWGWRGGNRPAKRRASVTVYAHDEFILAYDLIDSSQQLRAFLASRRNRAEYREVFPLIRSAMFAKAAEEQAEAPFAQMLSGVLARENGVSVAEAEADVPDLIRWFKLKNRWARALTLESMVGMEAGEPSEAENERTRGGRLTAAAMDARRRRVGWDAEEEYDEERYERAQAEQARERLAGQEHEALAVRMIVAEHRRRLEDRRRPINQQVVAGLRAAHPTALAVVRPRRGGYLVLVPADPHEHVYVHEHEYGAGGAHKRSRSWVLIGTDRPTRWTFAWRNEELWARWNLRALARDYLTGPERDGFVARLRHVTGEKGGQAMAVTYLPPDATHEGRYVTWVMTGDAKVPGQLLSGDLEAPTCVARERSFKRQPEGGVSVVRPRGAYWASTDHQWVVGQADLPWQGHYAKAYAKRFVWGPDREAVARWTRELERYRAAGARRAALRDRAGELERSISEQWSALLTVAEFDAFSAQRAQEGDHDWPWEEWEEHHRELHRSGRASGLWGHWDCVPYHVVRFLVAWLVERGADDLEGMTVREAFDLARAEHGLPERFVPGHHQARRQPLVLPDEVADLRFGDEPVEVPRPPDDDEPVEVQDASDDVVSLGDGIDVVGPEVDEPERDGFDELRDAFRGI